MLHVLNGDAGRAAFEAAGIPGTVAVYADVLHELRVDADVWTRAGVERRARAGAQAGFGSFDDVLSTLREWQSYFDDHAAFDEIVLWLEHDLFDQLLLIRHLAFFASAGRTTGVALVCTDEYLGPMQPMQLAQLYPRRAAVTSEQFELGETAWRAFTGADPFEVQRVIDGGTRALPFLRAALIRLLEEYPAVANGLGRIDAQVLSLLAERERTFAELFQENANLEEAVFLGDMVLWLHVRRLAQAREPLVQIGDDEVMRITAAGRDVAGGKLDAVALNGLDRWLGGVHLEDDAPWRWDAAARRLRLTGDT